MKKKQHSRSGQAIVEAALVLPVFLLLVLGILQTALMLAQYQLAHYSAFAACRMGAIYYQVSENDAVLQSQLTARRIFSVLGASKALTLITTDRVDDDWQVTVHFQTDVFFPVLGRIASLITLPATCRLQIEGLSDASKSQK